MAFRVSFGRVSGAWGAAVVAVAGGCAGASTDRGSMSGVGAIGGANSSASGGSSQANGSPSGGSRASGGSQTPSGGQTGLGSGGQTSTGVGGANNGSGGAPAASSGGVAAVASGGAPQVSSSGGTVTSLGGTFNDGLASPPVPPDLTRYLTGNDADANVAPTGPGLILMGGGKDVTAAFEWWNGYITHGDIVVLRTSLADGYNSYLFAMGGSDSVETLMVTSQDLANSDYVRYRVSHAEGVFLAGGDQGTYISLWKGTALQDALRVVYARGGVIGGTSAGLAVLGEFVYSALGGSAVSSGALANPFSSDITLDRGFLAFPALKNVITDTHFAQRDRFGRLMSFVGRTIVDGWATSSYGVGVSEATAIVIDPQGLGKVLGTNQAYIVEGAKLPERCQAGQSLTFKDLRYARLQVGDTVQFPLGVNTPLPLTVSADAGVLTPTSPY